MELVTVTRATVARLYDDRSVACPQIIFFLSHGSPAFYK
jgi:hypothetical protein